MRCEYLENCRVKRLNTHLCYLNISEKSRMVLGDCPIAEDYKKRDLTEEQNQISREAAYLIPKNKLIILKQEQKNDYKTKG